MTAHNGAGRHTRHQDDTADWLAHISDAPAQVHAEWTERGVAVLPLGRRFDAVRVAGVLVRAALATNAVAGRPLILDPHSDVYYALVPPQTTETWTCAFGICLGRGAWLGVPHPDRIGAPGPHWTSPVREEPPLCTAPGVRALIERGRHAIERAGAVPRERCAWCKRDTGTPVIAGIIHSGSVGGGHIHACPDCTATYRLLPLAEHLADSDGAPRCRPVNERLP
ncbi:hypothetical protein ACIP93_02030 [Streptomyces sp. NPDC088745]|uniref:hypothetical protein n=1 Tax=Streptomyces sp. NPDC088745 TaxID=3365884 RepID=UPI00380AC3B7